MARHTWPGNIRELRNAIERAAILAAGPEIGVGDLPERVGRPPTVPENTVDVGQPVTLDQLEGEHIRRGLAGTANLDEAAAVLGIDQSTLYRKRKRLGL